MANLSMLYAFNHQRLYARRRHANTQAWITRIPSVYDGASRRFYMWCCWEMNPSAYKWEEEIADDIWLTLSKPIGHFYTTDLSSSLLLDGCVLSVTGPLIQRQYQQNTGFWETESCSFNTFRDVASFLWFSAYRRHAMKPAKHQWWWLRLGRGSGPTILILSEYGKGLRHWEDYRPSAMECLRIWSLYLWHHCWKCRQTQDRHSSNITFFTPIRGS